MSNNESGKMIRCFFTQLEDDDKWQCTCGVKRSQSLKAGYTNLRTHLNKEHAGWEDEARIILKEQSGQKSITAFASTTSKGRNIFNWLEWVIMDNLPLSFVEKELTRKNTNLLEVGTKTLMKYVLELRKRVETCIIQELPEHFGLVTDGWSEKSTHYTALFAAFEKNSQLETPLLALSPPSDEEHYDKHMQYTLIIDCVSKYHRTIDSILYLTADNAPVNPATSDLLRVPFIGCASHRFNLVVRDFLRDSEETLQKVHNLMRLLCTLKQGGKLRKVTALQPVLRNKTRWSSTHEMIKRFFRLEPFLDKDDAHIAEHMPSPAEVVRLKKLQAQMEILESATKSLQETKLSLSDVRSIFEIVNELIELPPSAARYLDVNQPNTISHSPAFENAIVKVIDGDVAGLTTEEKATLKKFEYGTEPALSRVTSTSTSNFAERVALKKQRIMGQGSAYKDLTHIPPTSNICERLFSGVRLVLTDYRKRMGPYTMESLMFLKANRKYWDEKLVSDMVSKVKITEEDLEELEYPTE